MNLFKFWTLEFFKFAYIYYLSVLNYLNFYTVQTVSCGSTKYKLPFLFKWLNCKADDFIFEMLMHLNQHLNK